MDFGRVERDIGKNWEGMEVSRIGEGRKGKWGGERKKEEGMRKE